MTDHRWIRSWLGDSSMMLAAQALTVLATSLAAILVARTLEPEDWGVFSAFLGLSLALAIVVDFGLATWLLRELSRAAARNEGNARETAGRLLSSALAINLAVGAVLVLGGGVWAGIRQPGAATTVALLALLAYGALSAASSATESYLRSRREVRLVVAVSVVEKSLLLGVLVTVAATDAGLAGIGCAYLVAGLTRLTTDVVLVFVRRDVPPARPRLSSLRGVAGASAPFALTTASLNVLPRLDTLLLLTLSSTSAAWFAIGDRILGPALLIPATLGATLYPFLATENARRTPPWKLAAAMGAGGLILALVGILLAPIIVPALFGSAYEDAVPVAQLMLLVLPLVFATNPLLVTAFSNDAERRLVGSVLLLSGLGSVAIVVGQLVGEETGAALGFVLRAALFLGFIGVVATSARRANLLPDARPATSLPPGP